MNLSKLAGDHRNVPEYAVTALLLQTTDCQALNLSRF